MCDVISESKAPPVPIGMQMSYLMAVSPVPTFPGDIPLHLNIREMSDRGRPVVVSSPDSPEVRSTAQHSAALSSSVLFNHTHQPCTHSLLSDHLHYYLLGVSQHHISMEIRQLRPTAAFQTVFACTSSLL